MSTRAPALLAGLAGLAVLLPAAPAAAMRTEAGGSGPPAPPSASTALRAFPDCRGLVAYARARVAREQRRAMLMGPVAASAPGAAAVAEAAPRSAAPATAPAASGTNVQEAGIDEPDLVKTDGTRLFAVAGGAVHAVDLRGAEPVRVGRLELGDRAWGHELLLMGDRLLVLSRESPGPMRREAVMDSMIAVPDGTALAEVDVSDPARMRVVRTVHVEGSLLSARLTGATARVVVSSAPRALVARRLRSRRAGYVPAAITRTPGGAADRRPLVGCADVRRPRRPSGLGLLTVLTIDLARGLPAIDTDAVMTGGELVYASPTGLYIATQASGRDTAVHRFDTTDPATTTYAGSGTVPGTLLNQFALSEHDGRLRAATTDGDESLVTVLDVASRALTAVGRVRGLGPDERIHAVRFIGDLAYVVTFRETDPLYVVDLRDPARPRVAGELEIPGYSAYLHPIGDGLLLGVGQDATRRGRVLGSQLSVFDVSEPARPVRLHHRRIGDGTHSEAEHDHHAFLFWPPTGLAVVPVADGVGGFAGAVGFRVGRDQGIAESGRIEHPAVEEPGMEWEVPDPVRRSLVSGDRLLTLSDGGLMTSALDTLQRRAWLPLR